ncbi:MAG: hypothetical protein IT318_13645 [Anaerolineales bacterium]|nr:hypothetical protein [Anaerolineales bacterium]
MLPYRHTAYGLNIASALSLPELLPAVSPASTDLAVRLGAVEAPRNDAGGAAARYGPGEVCLAFREAGAFLVRAGREIIVDPTPGADARVLRLYLLGPALTLALHQRGWLALHASAVALGGQAVGFLGAPGWGKSTMAAALCQRGHPLIADDALAVAVSADPGTQPGGRLDVFPGFPQIKLWPEAAAGLGVDPAQLPLLHPRLTKRAHRLGDGLAAQPLPLGRLYVLTEGAAIQIEPLGRQAALVELIQHSYVARALPQLDASTHLRQCAAVARVVPVARLWRPRRLDSLPAVAAAVEAEVLNLPRPTLCA